MDFKARWHEFEPFNGLEIAALCEKNRKEDEVLSSACLTADWINDTFCDDENNNEKCQFDGGDCCQSNQTIDCTYCIDCVCNETLQSHCDGKSKKVSVKEHLVIFVSLLDPVGSSAPRDWTRMPWGASIKIIRDLLSYEDAIENCRKLGGQLLEPAHSDVIADLNLYYLDYYFGFPLRTGDSFTFWLGLHFHGEINE